MLHSVVAATRAHYAALQHKPSPAGDRIALDYTVAGHGSGTVWVKAHDAASRKRESTKLLARLRRMYPECRESAIWAAYRGTIRSALLQAGPL
jgi:hypothetical protein